MEGNTISESFVGSGGRPRSAPTSIAMARGNAGPESVARSSEGPEPVARSSEGPEPVAQVLSFQSWLSSVDVEQLSDRERIDLVAVLERVKGSVAATQARATHALRCSRELVAPQDVARSVGAEVALARRESPTLGDRFVGLSRALVTELPETMKALTAGAIGERHAIEVVQQSATLSVEDRAELDRRVGPLLGRLGVRGVGNAARRVAAELDAAAVVRRMEAAARCRRVTLRPAPDGMAYLTVLGPLPEIVGAYASLRARAAAVVGGQRPDERPDGRSAGAVMADTATQLLSGRAPGQPQPIEVHLVMTDRALMGTGDGDRSVFEPARIPGHGSVPAPVARAWLRHGLDGINTLDGDQSAEATAARVWVRRLYTSPDGRDLVAMDSRRRLFGGMLRRMLVLRDDVCTTPWCEAPIAHADHATPVRDGSPTSYVVGNGKCARCNLGKEAPGWVTQVLGPVAQLLPEAPGGGPGARRARDGGMPPPGRSPSPSPSPARLLMVTTPLGRVYTSEPPPLLGWGSTGHAMPSATQPHVHPELPGVSSVPPGQPNGRRPMQPPLVPKPRPRPRPTPTPKPKPQPGAEQWLMSKGESQLVVELGSMSKPASTSRPRPQTPQPFERPPARTWAPGRKRPCRRPRAVLPASPGRARTKRPRLTSHLERELCRLLR